MQFQQQQKEARKHNLNSIRSINKAVSAPKHLESDHVTPDVFAILPIQISSVPFYTDSAIDFGLRFSRPLTEEQFELHFGTIVKPYNIRECGSLAWEPYTSAREHAGGGDAVSQQYFDDIWRALSRCVRKIGCPPDAKLDLHNNWSMSGMYGWGHSRMLFGQNRATQLTSELVIGCYWQWSTFTVQDLIGEWRPPNGEDYADYGPHMACWLYHDAPLDDRILRSELVCITSMMKGRMKRSSWKAHRIFPVFCYTFNGPYVRITQAHFDGQYLQLRRTEPIEFAPDDGSQSAVKMTLRWMAAEPIGDTKWIVQADNLDELNVTQPPSPRLPQKLSTKT